MTAKIFWIAVTVWFYVKPNENVVLSLYIEVFLHYELNGGK